MHPNAFHVRYLLSLRILCAMQSFVQHPNGDMLRSAAKDEVCAVESPFLKMASLNPQDSTGSTASGTDSWLVPASPHRGHRN